MVFDYFFWFFFGGIFLWCDLVILVWLFCYYFWMLMDGGVVFFWCGMGEFSW